MTTVEGRAAGAQLDRENPWPGLASYDERSHQFFSGRTAEIEDLSRRIVAEPTTVLFGKSGLGKTSLLKAGVFPRVREKGLLPILLRLQMRSDAPPLIDQVRIAMFAEMREQKIDCPDARKDETLWEYLHRSGLEFWTATNWPARPLFVFDQFEEVFTLGSALADEVSRFREDLSDLAENRIPEALAARLGDRPVADLGCDVQAKPFKIVLSLREDYLADLEEWRLSMPSLRRNRMRLRPMSPDQAFEVVLNDHTRHLVTEPIAWKIVVFLSTGAADSSSSGTAGESVEPALLSLFCDGVNEQRKRDGKDRFDDGLVEGGKGTIVADFYRGSVGDQPERVCAFIEEQLVTEQGFRNSYAIADALAKGAVTRGELDTLINRHLLRHEHHLGADRVELTHDLLTKAVVEGRDRRRSREHRRLMRWGLAAAAAVVIVAVALAARFAVLERRATQAQHEAQSRELAAIAEGLLNEAPEEAVALAAEGVNIAETDQAQSILMRAVQFAWPSMVLEPEQLRGKPEVVAVSPDGSRLAVLALGEGSPPMKVVSLWDVTVAPPALRWQQPRTYDDANALSFSPDQKFVVVGRYDSIDFVDPDTGDTVKSLATRAPQYSRQVIFSPDGRFLAALLSEERIQIWNLGNGTDEVVEDASVLAFALLPGGTRIVGVDSDLSALALDRQSPTRWTRTKIERAECSPRPQSVSPGPKLWSMTWTTGLCMFSADGKGTSGGSGTNRRRIEDIVWSTNGAAFVEFIESNGPSGDVIIGTEHEGHRRESHLKGTYIEGELNKMHLVSVSDDATRAALIESKPRTPARVRVYSLFQHKPFFSSLDADSLVVAPDVSWLGTMRSAPDAKDATVIELARLDDQSSGSRSPSALTRITANTTPDYIFSAQASLVANGPEDRSPQVTVFDAGTGNVRYTREGSARRLGRAGELLLIRPSRSEKWRIVATTTGAPVSEHGSLVPDTTINVIPSYRGHAVAVVREDGATGARIAVYDVRDGTLQPKGEVELADKGAALSMAVSDEGNQLRLGKRVWYIPARPDVKQGEEEGYDDDDVRSSDDDRWMVSWKDRTIEVRDLDRNEIALTFSIEVGDSSSRVRDVEFLADNRVLQVKYEGAANQSVMLVPLDRALMDRFAAWLASAR